MIKREDLVKIGQFNKPHGIKGDISFTFTDDVFDESECQFLICELNGIFVPFQIESYRFKSNSTAFMKVIGIDSDVQAKIFINQNVYFPKQYVSEKVESADISSWDYFIGYKLVDKSLGEIGEITDVDDTTINTLFVVERNEEELLIPAAEDFISEIDSENKFLYLNLPEGLIDI